MTLYQTLAASAAIALTMGFSASLPLSAATVDEAQCATAKGSSDTNAIKQFCPEADWPAIVEPGAVMDKSADNAVNEGQCGDAIGSGDENAIKQFCPESDWPATMSTAPVAPAGNTVVAAQCNDAKGSGDLNAIKQFCAKADWPAETVN